MKRVYILEAKDWSQYISLLCCESEAEAIKKATEYWEKQGMGRHEWYVTPAEDLSEDMHMYWF